MKLCPICGGPRRQSNKTCSRECQSALRKRAFASAIVTLEDGSLRLPCGAILDAGDLERCLQLPGWHVPRAGGWKGYAVATWKRDGKKVTTALHRWILMEPRGVVDHIDGDTLNNRRSNMRVVGKRENAANMRKSPNQKRGLFKGVFPASGGKWRAQIGITQGGELRQFGLGTYDTPEDAARAYDRKAIELFGDHAAPNFGRERLAERGIEV